MRLLWKLLVGLVITLAVLITLNTITVGNDTKPAEVNVSGGQVLQLTGGDLQVLEDGPEGAPAVVLLHGWTGSISWWDRLRPLLARKYRVVSIDLLGHGGSEKPSNGYSMTNQAQLVAEAIHRLGHRSVTVVGHSMGAVVGTALAERSPQLVAGLVVVDQAPDDSYTQESLRRRASRTPVIGHTLWRAVPDSQFRDGLGVAFAEGFEDFPDRLVEDLRGMTYTAYTHSRDASDGFRDQKPLDERLALTSIPLLVIFGEGDQLVDPEGAEGFRDVPGAQIEIIEGAGHSPQFEKPEETARLIQDFVAPIVAAEVRAAREAKARAKRKAAEERRAREAKQRARQKARRKRAKR